MDIVFKPHGVCSTQILVTIESGRVARVRFISGCDGNLQGISRLVEGMDAREVVRRLKGIKCGRKPTSCPDQLATAIEQALR